MASVTKAPGTCANTTLYGYAWADVNNVKTSNDVYSTNTPPVSSFTDYIECTNFGFTLSATSVIQSITVSIESKASAASGGYIINAELIKNGTPIGYDLTSASLTNITDSTTDIAGVLWGTTWLYSDINASTFGVRIRVKTDYLSKTISIDAITITVVSIESTNNTITETVSSVTETIAVTTSTFDVSMANNNQAYILNRKTNYWTFQDNAPFTNALYRPSTQKILASCRSLGQIASFEGEDFAGVDIDSIIQTGYMNLGEFDEIKAMEDKSSEAVKRLRAFFADCKGEGNLTLTIYTENDSTGETFTLTLATTDNATLNAVRTALSRSLHGKYIAFKLTNASGNDFWIGESRMKILPKAIR
jgi:hypothetical protein